MTDATPIESMSAGSLRFLESIVKTIQSPGEVRCLRRDEGSRSLTSMVHTEIQLH